MSEPPSKPEEGHFVTANARYTGAWGEAHQRIGQRQNLISVFAFFVTLIFGQLSLAGGVIDLRQLHLLCAIPVLTVAVVILIDMHDMQIAVLESFLAKLELLGAPQLPNYFHAKEAHDQSATMLRSRSDIANLILLATPNVAAAFLIRSIWATMPGGERALVIALAVIVLTSFAWLLTIGRRRSRIYHKLLKALQDEPTRLH